jgi:hypothetical protein
MGARADFIRANERRPVSAADLSAAAHHVVLQPRRRNDEQRSQKEAEQRIQPNQGYIEATEAYANPDRAQRAMCFQGVLPDRVSFRENLAARRGAFQPGDGGYLRLV